MKLKLKLFLIILLGLILRVWLIDLVPHGFTPDEASFGYDAYSILLTGKDQWGRTLPLFLESFGDYKLPLYTYITIPFIYLFGLDKFSTRLPNALLGTAAIYVVFLLVRQLFIVIQKEKAEKSILPKAETVAILSSFLLAISPWHVMMSRGAFEANLTTFLMPLGAYLFLRGIKSPKLLNYSALVFGLNMFSYHSARLVTPILVLVLFLIFRKELSAGKKIKFPRIILKNKIPVFIFSFFVALSLYTLTYGSAARAQDISIFSGALEEASQDRFQAIYQGMSINGARFFHNKYFIYLERFSSNYFQYLSSEFLFINGPAEATYGMMPGSGVMYWFELPFLLAFFYSLFSSKNKKPHIFILIWILLAPIPAALTSGRGFAANRAVIMLPALTVATAIGAYSLYELLKKHLKTIYEKLILLGYGFATFVSILIFLENYFILSPIKFSKEMLYGNLEAAYWLGNNQTSEDKDIIVSRSLSEPHIYFAFINKWDPATYQKNTKNWGRYRDQKLKFLDQLGEYSYKNYTFTSIDNKDILISKDTLMVGRPDDFPAGVIPKIRFNYPNGDAAVYVVEPLREVYAHSID